MRTTLFDNPAVLSVTELTHQLQKYVEGEYGDICVEGEISGFKISHSGHAYFTLKDEGAVLSSVIWRSTMARMKAPLEDGQVIRASGGLSIYPPRGAYQLVVRKVELAGEGLLLKRFEELKKKLAAEGLFTEERKRPIPSLPLRIGVVTSPTGAAIRDFLKVLGRFPGPEVDIFPVRVQGMEAPGEIAHAVEVLSQLGEHDVIVVTRGGGSLEDLWCFNDESVARAIANCSIPVISAVGHEVDFTISDFVADLRVPTPTAAALHIVREREDLLQKLDTLKGTMIQSVCHQMDSRIQKFEAAQDRLFRVSPLSRIRIEKQRLDEMIGKMDLLTANRISNSRLKLQANWRSLHQIPPHIFRSRKERLTTLALQLEAMSPNNTLRRGYSLTADEESGQILKTCDSLKEGQKIRTRLYHGEIFSQVTEVKNGEN